MSDLTRTPLLVETASTYPSKKELSFKGGDLNAHTPREGYWLPKSVRDDHSEGLYKAGARGKRERRKGGFLKDEPLRKRAEPIRRGIGSSVDLARSNLLLSHDKPT